MVTFPSFKTNNFLDWTKTAHLYSLGQKMLRPLKNLALFIYLFFIYRKVFVLLEMIQGPPKGNEKAWDTYATKTPVGNFYVWVM